VRFLFAQIIFIKRKTYVNVSIIQALKLALKTMNLPTKFFTVFNVKNFTMLRASLSANNYIKHLINVKRHSIY
jgi:hypothetical protein